jgi:hypothetical protein
VFVVSNEQSEQDGKLAQQHAGPDAIGPGSVCIPGSDTSPVGKVELDRLMREARWALGLIHHPREVLAPRAALLEFLVVRWHRHG